MGSRFSRSESTTSRMHFPGFLVNSGRKVENHDVLMKTDCFCRHVFKKREQLQVRSTEKKMRFVLCYQAS